MLTVDRVVSGDSARSALDESPHHEGQTSNDQDVNDSGGDLEPEPEEGPEEDECNA